MNLFKLVGSIFVDNEEANKSISKTEQKAESLGSKFLKGVGTVAKWGAALTAAAAAGATALAAFTKSAVDAYADYEQLVGGVETLFGAGGQSMEDYAKSVGKTASEVRDEYNSLMKAQETVLANADEGYKTAGMSVNEYLETVTSFSASLIASLDGDTQAAADKANQAIINMSDNANKMGSDITSIQNAYQGFAKQNFGMLDNLKLGYGGTKEEMQRLIEEASKMKDIQNELGVSVDANSMSFANIVDAISVVQKNMGIMGTTSKEASETIAGSIASMKSAWQNLITGLGNEDVDLTSLTEKFSDSVVTVGKNIIPRVKVVLNNISEIVVEEAPKIIQKIPSKLIEAFPEMAEKIMTGFRNAFSSQDSPLANLIPEDLMSKTNDFITNISNMGANMGSGVFQTFSDSFDKIKESIETTSPFIEQLGSNYLSRLFDRFERIAGCINSVVVPIFNFLVTALMDVGTTIWEAVAPYVTEISNKFTELSGIVTDVINTYIIPTVESFIEMIQKLWSENQDKISKLGTLFEKIFSFIADIIDAGVEVFKEYIIPFFEWFSEIAQSNLGNIEEIFQSMFDGLGYALDFFIALFEGDWEGMGEAVLKISQNMKEQVSKVFELIASVIGNIVGKIAGAVSEKFEDIKRTMHNKITIAKNTVKGIFHQIYLDIKEKIDNAKTTVKDGLDAIKGFFDKLKLKLPDIKLPHFKFNGEFDLSEGKVPKIDVEWYAKGAVLNQPTIFGINPETGNPMVGGEAGAEAVAPIDVLQNYVRQAVMEANANNDTGTIIKLLMQIIDLLVAIYGKDTSLEIDGREFGRMVNKYA